MKKFLGLLLIALLIFSCNNKQKALILVSQDSKNIFQTWIQTASNDTLFKCFNMYSIADKDSIDLMLKKADGIIISGGEDVNPALYGKSDQLERCGVLDLYRDSLEQAMIKYAIDNKIPLLGVCRGHQIMNVTFGGSLIIDIPEDVGSDTLHRNKGRTDHMVYIDQNSYLFNIVQVDSGIILSNHHQAIDRLAEGYYVSSYASDDVIESMEPVDKTIHPFILSVQWHPEGMDVSNPLSGKIAVEYLKKVKEEFVK